MGLARLPESVQSLYAELLDQLRAADAGDAVGGYGTSMWLTTFLTPVTFAASS